MFGEMVCLGGGLFALQSLSTIIKGNGSFNFQSNELILKFLRQKMAISTFQSHAFRENMRSGHSES